MDRSEDMFPCPVMFIFYSYSNSLLTLPLFWR